MRIAVMVLGLMLSAWGFFEAALGGIFVPDDSDLAAAIGAGIVAVLIGAVGSAIAIPAPQVTMVLLVIAGLIGMVAGSGGYGNHYVYGTLYFILAVMAFFGWRGKRRDQREQAAERTRQVERDNRMESLLQQQYRPQMATSGGLMRCVMCSADNPLGTRFCGHCGAQLTA